WGLRMVPPCVRRVIGVSVQSRGREAGSDYGQSAPSDHCERVILHRRSQWPEADVSTFSGCAAARSIRAPCGAGGAIMNERPSEPRRDEQRQSEGAGEAEQSRSDEREWEEGIGRGEEYGAEGQ